MLEFVRFAHTQDPNAKNLQVQKLLTTSYSLNKTCTRSLVQKDPIILGGTYYLGCILPLILVVRH